MRPKAGLVADEVLQRPLIFVERRIDSADGVRRLRAGRRCCAAGGMWERRGQVVLPAHIERRLAEAPDKRGGWLRLSRGRQPHLHQRFASLH